MKISVATLAIGSAIVLAAMDVVPSMHLGIISSAYAIVGRPVSPVSYAGVARRTARRSAAHTTHTTTVVIYTLPQGCVVTPMGGVTYYHCGTTYYRAEYHGNDLVYVVAQP